MELLPKPLHVVIAYDPSSGRILQAHFSAAAPAEAEDQLRRQSSLRSIEFRLLHVESDQFDREILYRVDAGSGKLVPAGEGQYGFTASAGFVGGPQTPIRNKRTPP